MRGSFQPRLLAALLVLAAAARAEAGRAPEEKRPFRGIRCLSPEGVLPAISDLSQHYDHAFVELRCAKPRLAVIAGAYDREADAVRHVAELRGRNLPFGYPVVTDPQRLWLPLRQRIVVVVALFRNRKDADAWQRSHSGYTRVRVGTPEEDGGQSWVVVRLTSAGRVPAYGLRETIRLSTASAEGWRRPRATPRCAVAGDALFVFSDDEFGLAIYGKNNARVDTADQVLMLPVRCGARVRYVDPRATANDTVFWRDRNGVRRVTQITEAGCGFTRFETSVVQPSGERTLEHDTTLGHDGC
jgi:hypothetical protein